MLPATSSSSSAKGVKITNETIQSLAIGKIFKDNSGPINSLDFNDSGKLLVTSSDDESINLYDTEAGSRVKFSFSKKYGCDLVRFTHTNSCVLVASKNGWDDTIRYLSMHDNKFLRYFKGHRDRVVSLQMCPKTDVFFSSSLDNTVRMWDLNTAQCQGLLRRTGPCLVAVDPQELIFSVSAPSGMIKLYDLRAYDKGPFAGWSVSNEAFDWTGLKFSGDGKYILASTNSGWIYLIDAFVGEVKQKYQRSSLGEKVPLEASISPDGKYVVAGEEDGSIRFWETLSGKEVCVSKGHIGPVSCVQWNPKSFMLASACSSLAFWIPTELSSSTTD